MYGSNSVLDAPQTPWIEQRRSPGLCPCLRVSVPYGFSTMGHVRVSAMALYPMVSVLRKCRVACFPQIVLTSEIGLPAPTRVFHTHHILLTTVFFYAAETQSH